MTFGEDWEGVANKPLSPRFTLRAPQVYLPRLHQAARTVYVNFTVSAAAEGYVPAEPLEKCRHLAKKQL